MKHVIPFSTIVNHDPAKALSVLGSKATLFLSRRELLILQFTKLLNYFPTELPPEWGGGALEQGYYSEVHDGLEVFLRDMRADQINMPPWIAKKYEPLPWAADNIRFTDRPFPELGQPYDPYLSCNGAILTIRAAARILRLDTAELVRVKLRLLVDEAVIAECISRMLKPHTWHWPPRQVK